MDELLGEFITETNEFLEAIDTQLVVFEADPTDGATLNSIFRLVHTIKGTCGFLGLPRLQFVAHAGETLLGKFRDGTLVATPDQVQLVLESIDRIKDIMAALEATGQEPDGDDSALITALELASEGRRHDAKPAPLPTTRAPEVALLDNKDASRWDADLGRELKPGEVSLAELEAAFLAADVEDGQDNSPPSPAIAVPGIPERRANPPARAQAADEEDNSAKTAASTPTQSIRVNVDVLENLMTMVSELVLTRNQLMQMVRQDNQSQFKAPLQRLSVVTAELQDCVMKTRMQPIGSAWKKLPRIVRDAARDLDKKIDLVLEGDATELDRQVLELIKDPLTHMIRNSCDHGLETPQQRLAAGKPETGTIKLDAFHQGGHVVIEVSDDGAGLSTSRIRDKAIKNNVVNIEEAWTLSDQQIHRFIFAPGFSTAEAVTSISGRGVGMDVVRTNIELIGGTIDLQSREGQGTKFIIKIPLTLAIVSALIVGSGDQRFAVPQLAIVELVGIGGASNHKIETIHGAKVLRLRDRLLPLAGLSDVLGANSAGTKETSDHHDNAFVVVLQQGGQNFGIIVDAVYETEEIVVKPLAAAIADVTTFSGATILGDGTVIMILDPATLCQKITISGAASEDVEIKSEALKLQKVDMTPMIVFKAGGEQPKAIPLSLVTRLEDLDVDQFETGDGQILVQYRGELMPIVVADPGVALARSGTQSALVITHNGHAIALAVDHIIDIVEERLVIETSTNQAGILGVAVLRGKATEVLDVGHYLTKALGVWDTPMQAPTPRHIIMVERNPFFRNLLAPLLRAAGYDVEAVDTISAALLCAEYRRPAAVLADIDADAGAARRLLDDDRLSGARIVAMSGAENANGAGFNSLVRKSDRQGLIKALDVGNAVEIAA